MSYSEVILNKHDTNKQSATQELDKYIATCIFSAPI